MNTSSQDAIRFAHSDGPTESSTNWYMLLFTVLLTLFTVYWGFVRPTSRELTKLRRYVTSLELSVADLNVQRLGNGQTVSALELMVEQEKTTKEAVVAMREMRDLHRQMVQEAAQLGDARQALESLASLRAQIARQSTLIDSTNEALISLTSLRNMIVDSADETQDAKDAVNRLSYLRDGLIDSITRLEDAEPLIGQVQDVQQELQELADKVGATEVVAIAMSNAQNRVQERMAVAIEDSETTESDVAHVELTFDKVQALHNRIRTSVEERTDEVATAIETLELATDVKLEMKRASETFTAVKRMLSEFSLMHPALQQALDSLQPLSELANLRRLGTEDLRRVAASLGNRDMAITRSMFVKPSGPVAKLARLPREEVIVPADPIDLIEANDSTEGTKATPTELGTPLDVELPEVEPESTSEFGNVDELSELTQLLAPAEVSTGRVADAQFAGETQLDAIAGLEPSDVELSSPGSTPLTVDSLGKFALPALADNEMVKAVFKVVSGAASDLKNAATEVVSNVNDAASK